MKMLAKNFGKLDKNTSFQITIINRTSLSKFSNYSLSKEKKKLRDIEKIRTIQKELNDKNLIQEEHEDYLHHKDKYDIQSFLFKIGGLALMAGAAYLYYVLYNYPIFSKQRADSLLTVGRYFTNLNLIFVGTYLGFNIQSSNSIQFIKSVSNYKLLGIPFLFTILGVSHFYFLDNLEYYHIIPFVGINTGILTFEFLNKKRLNIPSWFISFRFMLVLTTQLVYTWFLFSSTFHSRRLQELELNFNKLKEKGINERGDLNNTIESLKYKI